MADAGQIRNFKDFLQLYNKVTELCFSSCVDNFYTRDLSDNESSCTDKCVNKFTNVNHKILGVYVELQGEIQNRRIAEYEAQQKANEEKLANEIREKNLKTDLNQPTVIQADISTTNLM